MNAPRPLLETTPHRMTPLARLPLFFALKGKRVVVAGGSAAACWKAELLAAAGATVAVFAEAPCEELSALAASPPNGAVILHRRAWRAADLEGAVLAVGASEDDAHARDFAQAARARGVPVNAIDRPAFCDFAFGAIVNRSPLVVGISTDGAVPVFAQAIRARIEAMIPKGFAAWAEVAQGWRARLGPADLPATARRRFWQIFACRALRNPERAPLEEDFADLVAAARTEGGDAGRGSVTFIGAGPGDPELLTLRAVRAMQAADVILYDDLVSAEVLDFARREARKLLVGKTGHGPACKQPEINALMVALARGGKRVARLKGGDPMIFGRAGEEIAACRAAGITVDVVPGISAAQGAAARLGLSLTHRAQARRLQYVTGHGADGALPQDIDWRSLADPTATTVVYMPRRTLPALLARAMDAGLDSRTPVLAIANATRPDETVVAASAATLAERLAASPTAGPVLVMIGSVCANADGAAAIPPTKTRASHGG